MYAGKRRSQGEDLKSHQTRRELQKLNRRRSERTIFFLIILGPVLLYFSYQMGRSLIVMRALKNFSATIDQRSPAQIKADLQSFGPALSDSNPFVEDAAMAAFKVATGWNLGTDPYDWEQTWREQAPYWEYHRSQPGITNRPASPAWMSKIPPAAQSATNPPQPEAAPATP